MKIKNLEKYQYIDICCNASLEQLDRQITEAQKQLVLPVIVAGDPKGVSTALNFSDVPVTLGVHPHSARKVTPEYFDEICKDGLPENCVAVGECGLDFDRMYSPADKQLEIFEAQIQLAQKKNMPMLLHERKAVNNFTRMLEKNGYTKGVVHCFTGKKETVEKYLDLGFYIGITGWITKDGRNTDLLESVKYIPLDRIVVETDAPYLLPQNYGLVRGKNKPEYVKYVVKELSKVLGIDEEELRQQIFENTCQLFGLEGY